MRSPCKEFLAPAVLTFYDLKHLLRRFLTAVFQPHFYDLCKSAFEKFHMIFDETVSKMLLCQMAVIGHDPVVSVISQAEIGLVYDLVIPDMTKQLEVIIAVEPLGDLGLVQFAKAVFQLFPYGIGKIVDIRVIGIEGAAV